MKLKPTFPALALLLLALAAGCTSTPERRLDQGLNVYAATLDALSDLREAGHIDDETQRRVAMYRENVEKLRASLSATTQPTSILGMINDAVDALIRIQIEAEKKAGKR